MSYQTSLKSQAFTLGITHKKITNYDLQKTIDKISSLKEQGDFQAASKAVKVFLGDYLFHA